MRRDKLFLVASCVDESIKVQTAIYDITLFKTFTEFEKYVNTVPVVIDVLIITSDELKFTNANMEKLKAVLCSPFVTIKGSVIYLIDDTYNLENVSKFFNEQEYIQCSVYQGIINSKFVHDIISGEIRDNEEGQVNIITYRMRKSEYLKQRQMERFEEDNKYETDEDVLSDIPVELEPITMKPVTMSNTELYYIVGEAGIERTIFTFLTAQYQALKQKTLIVERDVDYHLLTEMVTKADIPHLLVTVDDINNDINSVLERIKTTSERLIVVGAIKKTQYDYDFLFDLLFNNLDGYVSCAIKELNIDELPYGRNCTVVMQNNVPGILKCCNGIKGDLLVENVNFVGVQLGQVGPMNVSSEEMTAVICVILGKSGLKVETVKVTGLTLSHRKGNVYDILSVLSHPNRR